MSPPRTGKDVLELVRKSGLADAATIDAFLQKNGPLPTHPGEAAAQFYLAGLITELQAEFILKGKHEACRLGKYVLLARLGYATGELFHALHTIVKRRCTLWILGEETEAEWTARIEANERIYYSGYTPPPEHPNLVLAFDIDNHERTHFAVLEQLEGNPLLAALESAGGRFPIGEACGCAVQIANGLRVVHEDQLYHGSINPSNLFLCENGNVKILHLWTHGGGWHLPNSIRERYGRDPVYAAPEQHLDSDSVERNCDCYSLGAVLFRMICGRIPFDSEADFARRLVATPTPDDGVPPALVSVLTRMMAPETADRYQSMAEVIAALRPFVEPESTGDYPEMAAAALAAERTAT